MTLLTPVRPRTAEIVWPRRTGDRIRLAVAVLVTLAALVVLSVTRPSAPEASAPPPQAPPAAPGLEAQLRTYLQGRPTTGAVEVRDLVTGRQFGYRADKAYDSASVIKVAIMAATLRRQEQAGRALTTSEKSLLGRMIRDSDNGAASTLWNRLGRGTALDQFFTDAQMTHTTAGPKGYWGLTRVTAADQVVLMAHLARPSNLLTEAGRAYARTLMASVDHTQDWGISAGPGHGVTVELKNGWLPRGRHGWAVHSVGHVQGAGRDYLIAVLTLDNTTESKGIATVEGVSKIVWRGLAPA
ncbi:serine hydrolase [uncultured Friedmanniella sp.]|uniref:serine hydrolase n=1 Tax=uncultured Friedmanniella sp. TaxID=335381 RepID=UPI0035C94931